jgi:hypothetical protein
LRICTVTAVTAGVGAAAVEACYLTHIRPLQADLGIQLAGSLLVLWAGLAVAAFTRKGPRAWLSLLPLPFALIGPGIFGLLFVGCAVDTGNCP